MRLINYFCGGALVMAGLCAGLVPARAEACGGTFCDGGVPGPMPVDQTGENVIFVMGGEKAEVHIQISYDPDTNAEKFAWMIPLTAVPDFSVGSQPLFDQMLLGTVPIYGVNQVFESCGGDSNNGGTAPPSPDDSGFIAMFDLPGGTSDGPDVLLQETVGAFDVVVLQDTELAPIQAWLEGNGYAWDPNAGPILQQYLDEGNVIAALKLTNGAGLADVHPITLSYQSNETCFPLRLTRIAAVDDMDIRVFVLANDRAAPRNFKHVLVNPLKIDWLQFAVNYKEVISNAVDAMMADGRAFVTEYAGASATVQQNGVYSELWDEKVFAGLDPAQAVNELNNQGLALCYSDFDCQWGHPLVYGLLLEFLPPPDGVPPSTFYADLGGFAGDIDAMKWNGGAEFSAALLDRIIEPGLHAVDLLDTWPYLTRMFTTISPNEMMEDPIFHINPDLGEVPQLNICTNYILCNGDSVVTVPDGREVYVPGGTIWPDIPGEDWWEEEVQTIGLKGAPMTLVNNTAGITKKLIEWNLTHGWPREPVDTSGDVPTTGDVSGTGTTSSGGSGGTGESSGDAGPPLAGEPGCACRSEEGEGGPAGSLGLLGLLGLLGARRRRQPAHSLATSS
jgi:MYXO-CTERM domain-containing protein